MKRSFHSLVILATGSALLFASVGCERKTRTPANKSSSSANSEKPSASDKTGSGTDTGTDITTQKQTTPATKIEPKVESVNQAMGEMVKLYKDSGVQSLVVVKGTKNIEPFAKITDGKSSEYELNTEALNQMMEKIYAAELATAQKAKATKPEETALAQCQLKENSTLTTVINSMKRIYDVLNAQKIDGMDDANREAEAKRLTEIAEVLKSAIEKDVKSWKSTAESTPTETVTDEELDDAAGADA